MLSSFGWGVCPGHRTLFGLIRLSGPFFILLLKDQASFSGTFENICRWHLVAFELHGMTTMGKVFIPGNIVVAALSAWGHLIHL